MSGVEGVEREDYDECEAGVEAGWPRAASPPRYMGEGAKKREWKHWNKFVTTTPSMAKSRKRVKEGVCIGCGKNPCGCKNRRSKRNAT